MDFATVGRWLTGGTRPYHTLYHCMNEDVPWIALTVFLDLTIALGYVLIAWHWRKNERALVESPAKSALHDMKLIFVFCGLCGYLFIPIKMYWPAWRLYDGVLLVLAFYTWRYAFGVRSLKVIYNELERSAQLAADLVESREESERKSFFLNAISHDLRTPLNGLTLQMELAEMSLKADDRDGMLESFEYMKKSVQSSKELLDRFLEFARSNFEEWPDHLTRFELAPFLEDIVARFGPQAAMRGLSLRLTPPPALMIHTDRMKLEQILSNIISNAIKFTTQGHVGIDAKVDGETLEINVRDSGIGINQRDLGRIFEEFYQVHNRERNSDKGYGLGLAIANQLARQIGGQLSVESQPGVGSRFTILLSRDTFFASPAPYGRRVEPEPRTSAGESAPFAHH